MSMMPGSTISPSASSARRAPPPPVAADVGDVLAMERDARRLEAIADENAPAINAQARRLRAPKGAGFRIEHRHLFNSPPPARHGRRRTGSAWPTTVRPMG